MANAIGSSDFSLYTNTFAKKAFFRLSTAGKRPILGCCWLRDFSSFSEIPQSLLNWVKYFLLAESQSRAFSFIYGLFAFSSKL